MTKEEKIRVARQLEKMRVDVIEAGFPIASKGDFEAVKQIAQWMKEGKFISKEDIVPGIENFPATMNKLFTGENFGKLVLKVADA